MKSGIRLAYAAAAVGLALSGVVIAPSTTASASGCLEQPDGIVQSLDEAYNPGTHIGAFYLGYDKCNRTTYAELNFADTWVATQVNGGNSYIKINHQYYSNGQWYDGGVGSATNTNPPWMDNPGYPGYWDSPAVTINYAGGDQQFKASFHFMWWTGNQWYACSGAVSWNFTNGTPLGHWGWCAPGT